MYCYYHQPLRWYYDHKTSWYYGGEPLAWTQTPSMPSAALFGTASHEGGPAAGTGSASVQQGNRNSTGAAAAAAAAAAAGPAVKVVRKVVQLPAHPQAAIGGHQMPVEGRIGGAKGVGASQGAAALVDPGKVRQEGLRDCLAGASGA